MSKEQTRSNTPITAEEFCKELGIYPMDSNELCLDNTANQTQIKKINLCDLLETFAQAKVLEALERVQSDIGEWIPRHMKLKEKQFNEKEKQFTKGRIDCMMQISSHIETEVKPKYNDNI